MSDIHSTGRGGAGNIGTDTSTYTDGGIVHEGSAENAGSSGRGGAGNIVGSPRVGPTHVKGASPLPGASPATHAARHDDDVVPETDLRPEQADFHTGRGGAGNEHKKLYGGHSSKKEELAAAKEHEHASVLDKVKHALHLDGSSSK